MGVGAVAVSATVVRGDARRLPLADASVDLIVTSPPYWALRSYTDGGEHYAGQIGAEPTPAEYVTSLIDCTREWVRVLKPSGSLWVNLGDKYAGGGGGPQGGNLNGTKFRSGSPTKRRGDLGTPKSLYGLPWRYAIRCVDDLGLILRAEVIWSKPNGLPESVTDRVRRSHETWFHFTREPRYFAAVDAIRERHAPTTVARAQPHRAPVTGTRDAYQAMPSQTIQRDQSMNALGKLPGSVWEVATQPLTVPAGLGVDHFAAFPMEWPRRIIQGWSPTGICTACGEGRRPVASPTGPSAYALMGKTGRDHGDGGQPGNSNHSRTATGAVPSFPVRVRTITGEACACPEPSAPTRPAVVLDPFGGTGTTALVAHALGRHGVSVDMSADYCRLAAWRTTDPGQHAAALQVPKPPAERTGQLDLFGAAT